MKRLLAAMRFLTILPLPGTCGTRETDLARSVPFFPIVGVLLGGFAALMAWAASLVAPSILAGAAVVVLLLTFSGGLHLDGLSDTADGLLSSRPRQQALEIMKDSHAGAMGVMAIVCVLLLKFASLASVRQEWFWRAACLMPLAGRCTIVIHMALLPYVRPGGLGSVFSTDRRYLAAVEASVVLLAACWVVLGAAGWVVAGTCFAVALGLAAYFRHRIGGATGDTFGAACEIVEVVPAFTLALWGTVS
jgi:adenosylcobinamide-GDP ribazoletransferase